MSKPSIWAIAGKNIYLTGAAGQLGQQWRQHLVEDGAIVFPIDNAWLGHPVDVTSQEEVEAALKYYADMTRIGFGGGNFGPPQSPDALICAAAIDAKPGTPGCGRPEDVPLEDFIKTLEVNLVGVQNCIQVFAKLMMQAGSGSIILVSSIYGLASPDQRRYEGISEEGFWKPAAYSASKAGLLGLTRYWAVYLAPYGVRVNAVTFGSMARDDYHPLFSERFIADVPMRRYAQPGDFDGAIHFLVSDASSYMTGANLVVDGGFLAW